MAYIGTPPSNAFTSLLKQDFSTSATTGYTLDHAVNNANDIALFINFVRQEPTAGYAASGTSLVLTSATASSDDMYCVYLGQALQTVNPANASVGTAQLIDGAVTSAKLASGAVANTPAFHATNSATQDLNSGSYTKVAFNTETYDDGGVYDHSSNYRFTPGETGRFFIYYRLGLITSTSAQNKYPYIQFGRLYKNGSQFDFGALFKSSNSDNYNYQEVYLNASGVVNVTSASDYFELYALSINAAGAADTDVNTGSYFGAFKLIQ